MFIGGLGRWIEGAVLVAFVAVNFGAVFVALWWGLGKDKTPAPREREDKGAMPADGTPYVPGPPRP